VRTHLALALRNTLENYLQPQFVEVEDLYEELELPTGMKEVTCPPCAPAAPLSSPLITGVTIERPEH
jgi:hypothetical protein